jgi:DNA-binding HxlR family transcriptional regulator
MQYGQFCPLAKASEILCEKWTLLIVRELLMGGSRFNELQRGLSLISPTILTKRLNDLDAAGVLIKKRISGKRGYEYFLTPMGRELLPIVEQMGNWGMRWARDAMPNADLDVELLMLYLQRSIVSERLPGKENVIRFKFSDMQQLGDWWLVVKGENIDICMQDPGKDVGVYFSTDLRTMIQVWMGDISYRTAVADGKMKVVGHRALTRDIKIWLAPSIFAGIPPAREIA